MRDMITTVRPTSSHSRATYWTPGLHGEQTEPIYMAFQVFVTGQQQLAEKQTQVYKHTQTTISTELSMQNYLIRNQDWRCICSIWRVNQSWSTENYANGFQRQLKKHETKSSAGNENNNSEDKHNSDSDSRSSAISR